jgi:transcriptional regulator with XRE-family HTH domain
MHQFYQRYVDFFQGKNQRIVNILQQQIVVLCEMPNFIKHFRKLAKLSTADLAEVVGTSPQQVNHLEKGKRELTWTWAKRLAVPLNCNPVELLEGPGSAAAAARDEKERLLLTVYRNSGEDAKRMFDAIMAAAQAGGEKKGAAKNPRTKTGA